MTGTVANGTGRAAPKPASGPNTALPLPVGKVSETMTVPGVEGSNPPSVQPAGASMPHQRLARVSSTKAVVTPRPAASVRVRRRLVTRFPVSYTHLTLPTSDLV